MKPLWTRFLLLVVAGATLVVAGWFLVAQGESASSSLEGISEEELAARDIKLLPPNPGQEAKISREEAEEVVASRFPSVAVKQAILGRLVQPLGGVDTMVWAINLDPQDKDIDSVVRGRGATTVWFIAFVDANTGDFLFGARRARTPPGWTGGGGLGPEYYPTPLPPAPLSAPASQ